MGTERLVINWKRRVPTPAPKRLRLDQGQLGAAQAPKHQKRQRAFERLVTRFS